MRTLRSLYVALGGALIDRRDGSARAVPQAGSLQTEIATVLQEVTPWLFAVGPVRSGQSSVGASPSDAPATG
ncbi:hypothetical protein [Brachybacterium hainanense]|uniref:Uncharacterized protein n=1 Tax=Brachybacterium hainanense TaxID=1541174 RepID=A0ABV6RDV9_9MICO